MPSVSDVGNGLVKEMLAGDADRLAEELLLPPENTVGAFADIVGLNVQEMWGECDAGCFEHRLNDAKRFDRLANPFRVQTGAAAGQKALN